jgi:bloom syndrome protein
MLNKLIDKGDGTPEQRQHRREDLTRVVQFCMNRTDCRRAQVLQYFDEHFDPTDCDGTCDNCATGVAGGGYEQRDVSEPAKEALQLVKQIGTKHTMLHCIDVFRGSKAAKVRRFGSLPKRSSHAPTQIRDAGHDQLTYFGKGATMERGDVERLFQRLTLENALAEKCVTNGAGYTSAYLHVRSALVLGEHIQRVMHADRAQIPGSTVRPDEGLARLPRRCQRQRQEGSGAQVQGAEGGGRD